jgi:hypothetical protein
MMAMTSRAIIAIKPGTSRLLRKLFEFCAAGVAVGVGVGARVGVGVGVGVAVGTGVGVGVAGGAARIVNGALATGAPLLGI